MTKEELRQKIETLNILIKKTTEAILIINEKNKKIMTENSMLKKGK